MGCDDLNNKIKNKFYTIKTNRPGSVPVGIAISEMWSSWHKMEFKAGERLICRPELRLQSIQRCFTLLAVQYPDPWSIRKLLLTLKSNWEVWIDFFKGKLSLMHHMHLKRLVDCNYGWWGRNSWNACVDRRIRKLERGCDRKNAL